MQDNEENKQNQFQQNPSNKQNQFQQNPSNKQNQFQQNPQFKNPAITILPNDKEAKQRYKESVNIKNFLTGDKGIPFLIRTGRECSRNKARGMENESYKGIDKESYKESYRESYRESDLNESLFKQIDQLIDFYTSWASGCPIKKTMKTNKFELLKFLENFCGKPEVCEELRHFII